MWCNMVHSLLRHLDGRYEEEEVIQWLHIEVWNEPNLASWGKCGYAEYFKLFHRTFDAIKEVNPIRVGGPVFVEERMRKWIRHL